MSDTCELKMKEKNANIEVLATVNERSCVLLKNIPSIPVELIHRMYETEQHKQILYKSIENNEVIVPIWWTTQRRD